ncbi:MAG: GNAT family N-acetyltransferase [Candidatus Obscuribacterales bacterium]|nr:GNAT family N-acetyltransferase [Steroidobacteraceae bacterium]
MNSAERLQSKNVCSVNFRTKLTQPTFSHLKMNASLGELSCKGQQRAMLQHSAVLGMSVRRENRRQGIGKALVAHALEWVAHNQIIKRIELFVFATNQPAIKLYEQFGFAVEGRRSKAVKIDSEYIDDILMAKSVDYSSVVNFKST